MYFKIQLIAVKKVATDATIEKLRSMLISLTINYMHDKCQPSFVMERSPRTVLKAAADFLSVDLSYKMDKKMRSEVSYSIRLR